MHSGHEKIMFKSVKPQPSVVESKRNTVVDIPLKVS